MTGKEEGGWAKRWGPGNGGGGGAKGRGPGQSKGEGEVGRAAKLRRSVSDPNAAFNCQVVASDVASVDQGGVWTTMSWSRHWRKVVTEAEEEAEGAAEGVADA